MSKKWFTLIELLIVIIIIWILIVMFLPKFWNAKSMVDDLKRKVFINKISTAIITEETQGKELIDTPWTGGCFNDYKNQLIKDGILTQVNLIKDSPKNITYWTKINGCSGDFWIARTIDWKYIIAGHLLSPTKWNFILPSQDYKTKPYFPNINYLSDKLELKLCSKVKEWKSNQQCDITHWKSVWLYNNNDLKLYIEISWY